MHFAVFGLGWAEILVLGMICFIAVVIPVIILVVVSLNKGGSETQARKRAAEKLAADLEAEEKRRIDGKSSTDPRFEKDA